MKHSLEWVDCESSVCYYIFGSLGIHTLCRVTAYLPLWWRLPIHKTETELNSLKFTYLQKCLYTKSTEWILYSLGTPNFEIKAGCSLSHDSSYLRWGTMCSSEHPDWGEEAATTERWTTYKNGSLMWELARSCWTAIYYPWCLNLWRSLWISNEHTGINFSNHKISLHAYT